MDSKFIQTIKILTFLSLIILPNCSIAQTEESDSLMLTKINMLEKKVDSLEGALSDTRARMVTHSQFEGILRSINEDDQEFTDDDRRSKRRALDSLFKAAVNRPKQLTFTGQFLNVFQWDGKFENSINSVVGIVDLFAISSFGKNSLVFINLQGVGGDGPDKSFPTYSGWHAGAGSTQSDDEIDRVNILEAWVEYSIGKSSFTVGKIDLSNYYDPNSVANDEYSQFLSGSFVNNSSLAIPGNGPGLSLNSEFFGGLTYQFAVVSSNNSGDQIFNNPFLIAQLSETVTIKGVEKGAIRVIGYRNIEFEDGWGFGLSADYRLANKLYAFGRIGQNTDSLASNFQIKQSWSGGLQLRNYKLFGESSLTSGFALGQTLGAASMETSQQHETMLECYLRFNIKYAFFISTHFQLVKNAMGRNDEDLAIIGLRTRVAF